MCKTKALKIEQLIQKNIIMTTHDVQIYQKHYIQISYEDTPYKIRIYDDCKSISIKDLKKVFHESKKKYLDCNLKKQEQKSPISPFFFSKKGREEECRLKKKKKIETVKIVRNFNLESETNITLLEADFAQRKVEELEDRETLLPLIKREPEKEYRRKYKQNISSIINYFIENKPKPSEIQQMMKVKQVLPSSIFQKIQRLIIILALFVNIISIIWNFNCIDYEINK